MNQVVQINPLEKALLQGDLSQLSETDRIAYYKGVCESLGLNVLTKPFEYINLNNKLTLYATKSCTEQLRSIHKISLTISARDKFDDVYVVTARARNSEGREDEATGAVNVHGLKGDALANAFMKAETKAKRRVTLSICGLAILDETEIETIPTARVAMQFIEKPKTLIEQSKYKELKEYVIPFGPLKTKTINQVYEEFGIERLEEYLKNLKLKENDKRSHEERVFILEAETFLIDKEFKKMSDKKSKEPKFGIDEDEQIPKEFKKEESELDKAINKGVSEDGKTTSQTSKPKSETPKKASTKQRQELLALAGRAGINVPALSGILKEHGDDLLNLNEQTYYKLITKFKEQHGQANT